jgi:hypothetical protein
VLTAGGARGAQRRRRSLEEKLLVGDRQVAARADIVRSMLRTIPEQEFLSPP